MLGTRFENCNDFLLSFNFYQCQLKLCTFLEMKLKGTEFSGSDLQEADFSYADLSQSKFNNCNLHRAIFEHSKLDKADLRHCSHFIIDPELNSIKKAKFSLDGLPGLLHKYQIVID